MRKTGVKHGLQLVLVLFLLISSDILKEFATKCIFTFECIIFFFNFFYIKMRLYTGFLDLGYTSE